MIPLHTIYLSPLSEWCSDIRKLHSCRVNVFWYHVTFGCDIRTTWPPYLDIPFNLR